MHDYTRRLRTTGQRLFRALRQRIAHVTAYLQQLDECASLGVQRVADVVHSLRRR